MSAKWNARGHNGTNLFKDSTSTFGLYKLPTRSDEAFRIFDGVSGGLITFERQIRAQQRIGFRAGSGSNVMFHFGHRYMGGIRVTKYHHAKRITDKNDGDAGFVEQFCHRKIISRQRRDFLTSAFHYADGFYGNFGTHLWAAGMPGLTQMRKQNIPAVSICVHLWLKLRSNSSGVVVAVPTLPTTMPAA